MTDEQLAKVIMAINNLDRARFILTDIVDKSDKFSSVIAEIIGKIKECEEKLSNIQYEK